MPRLYLRPDRGMQVTKSSLSSSSSRHSQKKLPTKLTQMYEHGDSKHSFTSERTQIYYSRSRASAEKFLEGGNGKKTEKCHY